MNSQLPILRKTLEGIEKDGAAKHYLGLGGNETIDVRTSYKPVAQKIARRLLEQFPEEDSKHVKAHRAAYYLIHFIEDHEVNEPTYPNGLTLHEKLFSLVDEVQPQAEEDILSRLTVDEQETPFDSEIDHTEIFDPISKTTARVSTTPDMEDRIEQRKQQTARQILEYPTYDY